jgi:hypothetical protein
LGRSAGTETVIGTAAGAEPVGPSNSLSDDESLSDDAPASAVAPKPRKPNPPVVSDNVERIGIGGESYRIRAGENFAEIHVRRTGSAKSKTSFDWWTEPSSALAGTDYIPQLRTTTFFAPGSRTASLFIKMIPNPSRKQTAVFYVVIGDPSGAAKLGSVTKAAIFLSPN